MSNLHLSEAIEVAAISTWPYENFAEENLEKLKKEKGELTIETLRTLLRQGLKEEKVFAIYTLGYLGFPDFFDDISSFLFSQEKQVRWASAIVLGRHKKEHVFPILSLMLSEDMENYPSNGELEQYIFAAMSYKDEWRERVTDVSLRDWDHLMEEIETYEMYIRLRYAIIDMLCQSKQEASVKDMRSALTKCFSVMTTLPDTSKSTLSPYQHLLQFQKYLSFALGHVQSNIKITVGYVQAKNIFDYADGYPQWQHVLIAYYFYGLAHRMYPQQPYLQILEANIVRGLRDRFVVDTLEHQFRWNTYDREAFIQQLAIDVIETEKPILSSIDGHMGDEDGFDHFSL